MTRSFLTFASTLIVALSAQSALSEASGTCASIGYSTSCCPPSEGERCKANDGDCYCNADCYNQDDCCEDISCPQCNDPDNPRTCADVGITQCCEDQDGSCDVYYRDSDNNRCSCDVSCHKRDDCCPDAPSLTFCRPCNEGGKYPDCCYSDRNNKSACFVPERNCYCDPLCKYYGDCCSDATRNSAQCLSDYHSNHLSSGELQSFHNNEVLSRQRLYYRERGQRQRSNTRYAYQAAPADRVQQMFDQRDFEQRHRVDG